MTHAAARQIKNYLLVSSSSDINQSIDEDLCHIAMVLISIWKVDLGRRADVEVWLETSGSGVLSSTVVFL